MSTVNVSTIQAQTYIIARMLHNSSAINLGIVVIGAILTFLPLYLEVPSEVEDTPLAVASGSQLFRDACVALLSLVAPLIVDSLLDLTNMLARKGNKHGGMKADTSVDDCSFNWAEKILFIIGNVIVPLHIFLPRHTKNLVLILNCSRKSRQMLVSGAVACSLGRRDRIISNTLITFVLISYAIAAVLSSFYANSSSSASPNATNALAFCINLFGFVPVAVVLLNCVWWLLRIALVEISTRVYGKDQPPLASKAKASLGDAYTGNYIIYRVWFVLALISWGIYCAALASVYKSNSNLDDKALFVDVLPYILFVLSQSALSVRLVKFEVLQGLLNLIDSKKQYVRYISHEIRTPLNAAFLGLKLLMDDMKKSTLPKDEDRYETLCDVHMSCVTAIDVLNDLLSFEKLESGILTLNTESVAVMPFIEGCVNMFAAQAKSNNINLCLNPHLDHTDANTSAITPSDRDNKESSLANGESESSAKKPLLGSVDLTGCLPILPSDKIVFDKFKMAQVVRNLISNALKFSPPEGTVNVVSAFVPSKTESKLESERKKPLKMDSVLPLRGSREVDVPDVEVGIPVGEPADVVINGVLRIVVTDSGAGISPENQKRLFKEVVQFNPEKLQAGGGSGFGLFISKGIADLHKGTISVFSEGEGLGCAFTIEIPMTRTKKPHSFDIRASETQEGWDAAREALREPESTDNAKVEEKAIVVRQYRILIVDDSRLNRKMLTKVLTEAGHTCEEADDGVKAVDKVKEVQKDSVEYDAILMDFMMPNLDGPGATKQIRNLGYKAPIFGVTGNGMTSDINHFLSHGADKVFVKPFDMDDFHETMMNYRREPSP